MPQRVKNPLTMQETWVRFLGQEDPLAERMAPTPVFLPGESHGQRAQHFGLQSMELQSQTQLSD